MLRVLGWLVTWEGRVSRAQYVLAGAILVIIKYGIDRSIAAHFGEQWQIWNYVLPVRDLSIFGLGAHKPQMYGMLWAVAIPFFWFGTSLTLRRLRDAGIQRGWIALFFIPIANLLLFLWLSIA